MKSWAVPPGTLPELYSTRRRVAITTINLPRVTGLDEEQAEGPSMGVDLRRITAFFDDGRPISFLWAANEPECEDRAIVESLQYLVSGRADAEGQRSSAERYVAAVLAQRLAA